MWCHRRVNSAAAGTTIDPRWARLLDALHPDEFPLRERVKEQFDAAMIDHISRADYGHDAERHRRAVSDLLAARTWPGELDWVPLEVLQLTRWSRPELPDGPLPPTGRRGHLMRLFACMALIRVRTPNGLPVDTLAPFVASAVELGSPFLDDAVQYLAWCRRHEPGDWRDDPADLPFLTFALLLLATATRAEPDVLGGLGGMLLREVAAVAEELGEGWRIETEPPLLGPRPRAQRHRVWYGLAGRFLVDGADGTDLGGRLAELGRAVRGESGATTADLRDLFATWDRAA